MSCENCENLGRNKGIYAEVFEQIAADDSREVRIPINFCPTCGEPLTAPKPLTLKELKERDGKPVWVVVEGNKPHGGVVDCRPFAECVMTGKYERLGFAGYVKHFVAYDREPKEES